MSKVETLRTLMGFNTETYRSGRSRGVEVLRSRRVLSSSGSSRFEGSRLLHIRVEVKKKKNLLGWIDGRDNDTEIKGREGLGREKHCDASSGYICV